MAYSLKEQPYRACKWKNRFAHFLRFQTSLCPRCGSPFTKKQKQKQKQREDEEAEEEAEEEEERYII